MSNQSVLQKVWKSRKKINTHSHCSIPSFSVFVKADFRACTALYAALKTHDDYALSMLHHTLFLLAA